MVNDDAPRPHTWEQPRPADDWLICRVCSGYKAFVDLDQRTIGRLQEQVEKACGKGAVVDFFVEKMRVVREFPGRRVPPGQRPPPPRDPADTTGTWVNDGPPVARRRHWELTDLFRCRGPRRPVG